MEKLVTISVSPHEQFYTGIIKRNVKIADSLFRSYCRVNRQPITHRVWVCPGTYQGN